MRGMTALRPLKINCVVNLVIWRNDSSIYNFKIKSFFEEDVLAFINKLPSETNVDILGYDYCILKLSSEIICSSLTILFNMSLSNGEIPNEWKKARVTAVYKNKGSKQDPNNFRPISVIGQFPKLFDKLVDSQLREYLQSHSFITHSQSDFMKLHSTETSLHNVNEYVLDNINKTKSMVFVCLILLNVLTQLITNYFLKN